MIRFVRRPPLRFMLLTVGSWTALRTIWLAPWPVIAPHFPDWRFPLAPPVVRPAPPPTLPPILAAPPAPRLSHRRLPRLLTPLPAQIATEDDPAPRTRVALLLAAAGAPLHVRRTLSAIPLPEPAARARLRLDAYVHLRSGSGRAALAPGGQLGGSQAYLRATVRLARHFAAAARVSTPLHDTRGAEAALGLDWLPAPTLPLRLSAERRIALGPQARDAWSLYAAGGAWRQVGRMEVDGYAQAGVVGARRRDLFADGAVRAGHRLAVDDTHAVTLGAGAWGAAQPGVARVDIGPRAALALPIGPVGSSLALEGRLRVAGRAAPGSGVALTLAAGF